MSFQKILLWGWFGFENLGDDLLLDTMIRSLNSPERMITVPMQTEYTIKEANVKQMPRGYKELLKGVLHNDVLIIGPGGLFPFDNPKEDNALFPYRFAVEIKGTKSCIFRNRHFKAIKQDKQTFVEGDCKAFGLVYYTESGRY